MIDKIKILEDFSEKSDLWSQTMYYCLNTLENYISDGTAYELGNIEGLTKEKFKLSKDKQSFLYFNETDTSFIVRTTVTIETQLIDTNIKTGYFSLDLDHNNEIIDTWLVFN